MALEGTIKDFGLPDIFQLIGLQRKTGHLTLINEKGGVLGKQIDVPVFHEAGLSPPEVCRRGVAQAEARVEDPTPRLTPAATAPAPAATRSGAAALSPRDSEARRQFAWAMLPVSPRFR